MQIRIVGSNVDNSESLTNFVKESLEKSVKKYFEKAVSAEVHFHRDNHLFKVVLIVNEGVKRGINLKSNGEAGDAYGAFNEAVKKVESQLRRYKDRIKNYRQQGGGLKAVEPNYQALNATKYVLPPVPYNILSEIENEEIQSESEQSHKIISEKTAEIEELTVEEAIMKMDLVNLPALVFINSKNRRVNVVYHRKDGNISWIDIPQSSLK